MTDNLGEVFRGHVEECVSHLANKIASRAPKGTRRSVSARAPLAQFCGVNEDTVRRWFLDNGSLPIGEPLIRLICWLDLNGYRVIELERMSKVRRNFVELIGFGIITTIQARELLGYSSTSTLYQVLYGHQGVSGDREKKMWAIWKERKEELERKRDALGSKRELTSPTDMVASQAGKTPEVKVSRSSDRQTAILNLMGALVALLEERSGEKIVRDTLVGLRLSADTILRLSAHLSTLSSRIMSQEQGGADG